MPVRAIARAVLATPYIVFWRPLDVIGNDQIQPTVFVVIKPASTGGPSALIGNTTFGSHVRKSSVSIVVVENRSAITSDIEIGIPVIVVVTDRYALSIMARTANSSLFRDVGESPIAIVVVESTTKRMWRLINIGRRGLDEEEVHQSVLVIVEPSDTRTHRFEVVL